MSVKFIADIDISPLTVSKLQKAGYAIVRVTDKLPSTTADSEIIQLALKEQAAIVAQSGLNGPSVVSLRVANARPDIIAEILVTVLPSIEAYISEGAIVSIDEYGYRVRILPVED